MITSHKSRYLEEYLEVNSPRKDQTFLCGNLVQIPCPLMQIWRREPFYKKMCVTSVPIILKMFFTHCGAVRRSNGSGRESLVGWTEIELLLDLFRNWCSKFRQKRVWLPYLQSRHGQFGIIRISLAFRSILYHWKELLASQKIIFEVLKLWIGQSKKLEERC